MSVIFVIFAFKIVSSMKKIALAILLMMPVFLFGQTYESLWKQVENAQKKDLPQTELQALNKIAAKALKEAGALSVRAMCVHPVLSGKAYENLENSVIEELIVTDSIPLKKPSDRITVLSTGKLFASVIDGVVCNSSISNLFNYDHFKDIEMDDMLIEN